MAEGDDLKPEQVFFYDISVGRDGAAHGCGPFFTDGGISVPDHSVTADRSGNHGAVSAGDAGLFHADVGHRRGTYRCGGYPQCGVSGAG